MAIYETKREWSPEQLGYVRHYLLHDETDVQNLPVCCVGSKATVCVTDNEYVYTTSGWKLESECEEILPGVGGSGGGGGLTEADKAALVQAVIAALPVYDGEVENV